MSSASEPRGWSKAMLGLNASVVYAFFYAPILLLVVYSFSDDKLVGRWGGFTLRWYEDFGNDANVKGALWVSVQVAIISTLVSLVLGTMAALSLERFNFRGKKIFDALLYLPIIIPDVTMAVMLLMFFSQFFKVLDSVFGLTLSKDMGTLIISHIAFNISFVSIVVRARLEGMDQRLEEAAADLYASRWNAFRHVTFPQILPGIAGGALLALTLSLDDVVISQFVGGPGSTTLPVYVFGLIRKGVSPLINAVSVVMLAASIVLVGLSLLAQRKPKTKNASPSDTGEDSSDLGKQVTTVPTV